MTRKYRLLEGIPASPGIVMGPAHVLTQEGQVSTRLLYNDLEVAAELTRFNRAGTRRKRNSPASGGKSPTT